MHSPPNAFLHLQLTTASKAIYDSNFTPARLIGVVGIDILASDLEDVAADYDQLLSALVQRSNTCPSLDLDMCELSFLRATDYSTSGLPSQYTEAERLCDPNDLDNCNTTMVACTSNGNFYTQPSISAVSETDPHFGSQRSSYSDEVRACVCVCVRVCACVCMCVCLIALISPPIT